MVQKLQVFILYLVCFVDALYEFIQCDDFFLLPIKREPFVRWA
jgi:hypothetical protein